MKRSKYHNTKSAEKVSGKAVLKISQRRDGSTYVRVITDMSLDDFTKYTGDVLKHTRKIEHTRRYKRKTARKLFVARIKFISSAIKEAFAKDFKIVEDIPRHQYKNDAPLKRVNKQSRPKLGTA